MKKRTLAAFLLFATHFMYSQSVLIGSGGNATGSGGSFSYTVGQVFYTTASGSNGSLSMGVQQSIELLTLSNHEFTALTLKAVTYPNPTSDYVVLSLKNSEFTNLSYAMYNIQGRTVAKGIIHREDTPISMQSLAFGTYILKVNQNNQELKTFKIIKK